MTKGDFYVVNIVKGPLALDEVQRTIGLFAADPNRDDLRLVQGKEIPFTVETQPRIIIGKAPPPPAKKERKPRAPKPAADKKPRASSDPGLGAAILSTLATAGDKGLSMGELVAQLGADATESQIRRAIKGLDGVTTTGNKRSTRYYAAAVQS